MPPSEIAQASLAITLFGPLQVRINGLPLPPFRSRKPLWLLALLTLRSNRPVEREWLAGTLWPDVDQSRAFTNLRPVLSELRKALATEGKRLQSPDRATLLLDLTDAEVDLLRFDAAIASGKLSDLQQAMGLYRGPLMEGCSEEWVPQERQVREQAYLQASQTLGEASLADGDFAAAASYFQQSVRIDAWREDARRGWMEALSRNGDTNAALQVYREFVAFLKDDPKAVPDEQTSALYQRLRTEMRERTGAHVVVPAEVIAVPEVKGYLPHPLTDLVGREDECIEVALQLRRSRLVTLTGMGGIGKTRLAREVAHEVVGEYADGVWLVALDALSEGRLVIQQIASVLGLREEPGRTPLQRVTEHLRPKRLLLVLDNCEHLLEASAQVVAHLLAECGEVRILATSREALGITGEAVWSVPALAVPDPQRLPQGPTTLVRVLLGYESVQLFVARAQAVQMSFALTGSNARGVAQACQQLEGIPLAIELAAARVRAMSIEQIASRLEDYLGLLTVGSRTAQSRQQTLRATLDWSYALLSEPERSLLRRLSVFAGGCFLEAAERVCAGAGVMEGQVLDLLASLVDKSLVLFEEQELAEGRYRLLEMVRQYATEGLQTSGEADQVKTRHRDWFLALAEEAEPQLQGAEQESWLHRLEMEHANLRAALAWSETESQGVEAGLRMAGALYRFWYVRGDFNEGRASLGRALDYAKAQGTPAARAKALYGAGTLALVQADYASAQALYEESLGHYKELEDRHGIARTLNGMGNMAQVQGNTASAQALYEECLGLQKDSGDPHTIAGTLINLGQIALSRGEFTVARSRFEESLKLYKETGDRRGIAWATYRLGLLALGQSDYALARTRFEESLSLFRELGEKLGIVWSLDSLGRVSLDQGDYATAQALSEECLGLFTELGYKRGIAQTVYRQGMLAHLRGDYASARTMHEESLNLFKELEDKLGIAWALYGLGGVTKDQGDYASAHASSEESLDLFKEIGDRRGVASSLNRLGMLAHLQGDYASAQALSEESLSLCKESGNSLGIAWALYSLGNVANDQGNHASARTMHEESLCLFKELGDRLGGAESLHGLASVMLELAELQKAARLWGASHRLRERIGVPLPFNELKNYHRQMEQARSALGVDAFAAVWEKGRSMNWEQAVAYALEPESEL